MSIYQEERVLRTEDVDMNRRLRVSALFTMIQEAAIAHTEDMGMGREKTLDKGLLWMVTLERAEIERMPEYGERVRLESWPGDTLHLLFPRYCRLLDDKGKTLLSSAALWALVDAKTRKMVFPEKRGIKVEGQRTGNETALPKPVAGRETEESRLFTVPYSYADLNGHMNNTRYFDLAQDCVQPEGRLREIACEFSNEARYKESFTVGWSHSDGDWYISGENEKRIFRMELKYE